MPHPLLSRADGAHGVRAESRARWIAAVLGLPDFVYRVPIVRHGASGNREPGDALLVANGMGAIVQVKSREAGAAASGKSADLWVKKHMQKAYRQAIGSRRRIARAAKEGAAFLAYPVRAEGLDHAEREAMALKLDSDVSNWPLIVLIDHPAADGIPPLNDDAFFVTLADWEWLHRAVRSTTGILMYVSRVLAAGLPCALGQEQRRYAEVADADASSSAVTRGTSVPWFSFDALHDPVSAQLCRSLVEGVWPSDRRLPKVEIADYRRVVEFLDAIPPGSQTRFGRKVLEQRAALRRDRKWQSTTLMFEKQRLYLFACDRAENYESLDEFDADLSTLAATRAQQARESLGYAVPTLAVGHLVDDHGIDYRYIYAAEPPDVPTEIRRNVEQRFKTFDPRLRGLRSVTVGRNEPCPCGSTAKYKRCCGAPSDG